MNSPDRVTLVEYSRALRKVAELLETGDTTGIEGGDPAVTGFIADGAALQLEIGQGQTEGGFLDSRGLEQLKHAMRFAGERVQVARNSFIQGEGSEEAFDQAELLAHTLAEGYHVLNGSPGYRFKKE